MIAFNERSFNDLYYVCSLIESIGRVTKNHRGFVVKTIGTGGIKHLLDFADVFHCMTMEESTDEAIQMYHIPNGDYDSIGTCEYPVPGVTAIGRVYARLVDGTRKADEPIERGIVRVFNSFISDEISNFNSDVYYSNPSYLKESYLAGGMLN